DPLDAALFIECTHLGRERRALLVIPRRLFAVVPSDQIDHELRDAAECTNQENRLPGFYREHDFFEHSGDSAHIPLLLPRSVLADLDSRTKSAANYNSCH